MTKYKSSYSTASLRVLELPTQLTLDVNKDSVEPDEPLILSGTLTSGSSRIINATVYFAQYVVMTNWSGWVRFGNTKTDAMGNFQSVWSFTQGGDYEVRAEYTTSEGTLVVSNSVFFSVGATLMTTITAALEDSTIYLEEDFVVYGSLVDENGNGVPNATINISVVDKLPIFSCNTDAAGNYRLQINSTAAGITSPGSYLIRISFGGGTL